LPTLQRYPVRACGHVRENQNDTKRQKTFGHFSPHILIGRSPGLFFRRIFT
jgi:hypothetical protein